MLGPAQAAEHHPPSAARTRPCRGCSHRGRLLLLSCRSQPPAGSPAVVSPDPCPQTGKGKGLDNLNGFRYWQFSSFLIWQGQTSAEKQQLFSL